MVKVETQRIFHQRTFVILSATLEWQGEIVSCQTVAAALEKCMRWLLLESQMNNHLKFEKLTLFSFNLTPDSILVHFFSPATLLMQLHDKFVTGQILRPLSLPDNLTPWLHWFHLSAVVASTIWGLTRLWIKQLLPKLKGPRSQGQLPAANQASVWQPCHPYLSGLRTPYEVRQERWNSAWHSTLLSWKPDLDSGKKNLKTIMQGEELECDKYTKFLSWPDTTA